MKKLIATLVIFGSFSAMAEGYRTLYGSLKTASYSTEAEAIAAVENRLASIVDGSADEIRRHARMNDCRSNAKYIKLKGANVVRTFKINADLTLSPMFYGTAGWQNTRCWDSSSNN